MKRPTLLSFALAALAACGEGAPETTSTSTSTASPTPSCGAASAAGIDVAASDPYGGPPFALGYPPYAIEGCSLAYVTPKGELRLRDLTTGEERALEGAAAKPRRPAIAGDLLAWEVTEGGRDAIRVRDGATIATIQGAFEHAREPRVAKGAVVFSAWRGPSDADDTDVMLYEPASGAVTLIAGGPGQQRFADVSDTHVAWTDFAGAFGGADDTADIVVLDRAGGVEVRRSREGKQAFPALGAEGKIAYLDWGLVHPEPKFSEYEIRVGALSGDGGGDALAAHVVTQVPYLRPAARGDHIFWLSAPPADGGMALMRRSVDLSGPAVTVSVFADQSAFGPAVSDAMTLVGAASLDGRVTLRAFPR